MLKKLGDVQYSINKLDPSLSSAATDKIDNKAY